MTRWRPYYCTQWLRSESECRLQVHCFKFQARSWKNLAFCVRSVLSWPPKSTRYFPSVRMVMTWNPSVFLPSGFAISLNKLGYSTQLIVKCNVRRKIDSLSNIEIGILMRRTSRRSANTAQRKSTLTKTISWKPQVHGSRSFHCRFSWPVEDQTRTFGSDDAVLRYLQRGLALWSMPHILIIPIIWIESRLWLYLWTRTASSN